MRQRNPKAYKQRLHINSTLPFKLPLPRSKKWQSSNKQQKHQMSHLKYKADIASGKKRCEAMLACLETNNENKFFYYLKSSRVFQPVASLSCYKCGVGSPVER
ncbi:hypothetical protein AVEN_26263-1 [Araneus ventricosus]|uniref:Uncharacterized protein n=1 Tax=Araneus ventricosus TaxID=182803 RepID=A0A4Y2AMV2_ARAVE|nr:hypothetical protein AVEN_26263-1 [Araneus ventricosus]